MKNMNPFLTADFAEARRFLRRRWISLIIALVMAAFCRSAATGALVNIPLETCGFNPATNRNVTLTPLQALGSNTIPVMDKIQGTTDVNGNWTPTLMPGVYQADVRPVWGAVGTTEFYFYVDPSNAVQDAFTNLLTGTNNTYPPNQYAYSAQASDARYAAIGAVNPNAVTNTQANVVLTNAVMIGILRTSKNTLDDGNGNVNITGGSVNMGGASVAAGSFTGTLIGNAATATLATNASTLSNLPGTAYLPFTRGFYVQNIVNGTNQWLYFGGYGDGQFVSDISVTTGVTHVSSPLGHWGSTNVGNMIGLTACGSYNPQTFYTFITNVLSPTDIIVSNAPPNGCTNLYYCIYGQHDDSSALQSAVNYAALVGGARIVCMPGVYLFETNFTDVNENNAQIIVPFVNANTPTWYNNAAEIDIEGSLNSQLQWIVNGNGYLNPTPQETVFCPMVIGNDITSSNFFGASFFDCRPYDQGAFWTYGVPLINGHPILWPDNDIRVRFKNISFITSYDPHICVVNLLAAIDGSGLDNCEIVGGAAAGAAFDKYPPRGTNSIAYIPPGIYNGTYGECYKDLFSGFFAGVSLGNFNGYDCNWNLCSNAVDCYFQSAVQFTSRRSNVSDCPNFLANLRGNGSGYGCNFDVDFAIIQGTMTGESGWWTNNNFTIQAIADPNGAFSDYSQGSMFISNTNANGMPVVVTELYPNEGIDVSYLSTAALGLDQSARHWLSQQVFDGGYGATSGNVGTLNASTGNFTNLVVPGSGTTAINPLLVLNANGDDIFFNPPYQAWEVRRVTNRGLNNANLFYSGYCILSDETYSPLSTAFLNNNASWTFPSFTWVFSSAQANAIGLGLGTNGFPYAPLGLISATNGAWTSSWLNSITNGMTNIMFWQGPSNSSYVSLKYSNGAVFYQTLQQ
jgi:hypothetical protein